MTNVQRWMLRRVLPHGITMVNRSGWGQLRGSWVNWSGLATAIAKAGQASALVLSRLLNRGA
jgi:hypothetical protein